ncbi:hypothetical protein [Tenacibaculum sp. IB213877]|uniref:hypothetical protein n=1 Tax=Tenacibaculum sp. IB213877 TaxID=3097351 RepID=UPI002A5A3B4F|nr:hypothetical protein [Tenacibaculum sp. IB213877]MDY0781345.1 hypothetical protein [Tenacibaculum sp. IB213877]
MIFKELEEKKNCRKYFKIADKLFITKENKVTEIYDTSLNFIGEIAFEVKIVDGFLF